MKPLFRVVLRFPHSSIVIIEIFEQRFTEFWDSDQWTACQLSERGCQAIWQGVDSTEKDSPNAKNNQRMSRDLMSKETSSKQPGFQTANVMKCNFPWWYGVMSTVRDNGRRTTPPPREGGWSHSFSLLSNTITFHKSVKTELTCLLSVSLSVSHDFQPFIYFWAFLDQEYQYT